MNWYKDSSRRGRKKRKNSRKLYRRYISFLAFLESKGVNFKGEMKRFYVTSYRNYLIEKQYELATINKKVNSIHSFNRYLVDSGCIKDVVLDIAKG